MVNTGAAAATLTLELHRLDGSSTGLTATIIVPANGQTSTYPLLQLPAFSGLPASFQGIMRVSSTSPIQMLGIRSRFSERGDYLITTTPPVNEAALTASTPVYFPQIADSGGYTTQFIVFSGSQGQSGTGELQFFAPSGQTLDWSFAAIGF